MPAPTSARARPGRGLLGLLALTVVLIALMFGGGTFAPKLALDLAGGTTVILTPESQEGQPPTEEQLEQAQAIMQERVNGLGISEADVALQGDNIIVSVPGEGQEKVVRLIGTTAKMDFRQVLAVDTARPQPNGSGQPTPSAVPSDPETVTPTSRGRAVPEALATETPSPTGSEPPPEQGDMSGIDPAVLKRFQKLDCSPDKYVPGDLGPARPDQQIVACEKDRSLKYVLDRAAVEGTDLSKASAGLNQQTNEWEVYLTFNSKGAKEWAEITTKVNERVIPVPPRNQIAVVLDGLVQSAPVIREPIPGGTAQISGSFDQQSAQDLAQVLQYGALPLTFTRGSIDSVSPTLGEDQLVGGLTAGAIGFALIVLFALYAYRLLGLVAVFSLAVGGGLTYLSLVVLGQVLGYRLSLAGIAGLIVAIGITVDSFIVYFERIRDEMREGRSLRTAIERAWVRARRTILVADAVQFLAAVVLYFLAVGNVAGFAFTLGLTTLIDVVVVFLFTKPVVTLLGRTRFYRRGHRLSGVNAESLGLRSPRARAAGGEA